jgi:hypothetical protein
MKNILAKGLYLLRQAAISFSGELMGWMLKFSTSTFWTLGVRKAGIEGPSRIPLNPRLKSVKKGAAVPSPFLVHIRHLGYRPVR